MERPRKRLFHRQRYARRAIRHSFGYSLPHRGLTRNDGVTTAIPGSPTATLDSYWKSNPYLTSFTGEDDSVYPQWVIMDLANNHQINAIRIAWAEPYARRYVAPLFDGIFVPSNTAPHSGGRTARPRQCEWH